MRHRTTIATLSALGLLGVSACATENETTDAEGSDGTAAVTTQDPETEGLPASMNTADGAEIGTVEFLERDGGVEASAQFSGLEPGFYGFHIHGSGTCETDSAAPDDPEDTGDFLSAGGHLNPTGADHPDHAGDLPQLLVTDSGDAELTFLTDRFTLADLTDGDGAAVIIHSDPDNYANVPGRYATDGVDEDTTSTGDAGDRLACGVIGA